MNGVGRKLSNPIRLVLGIVALAACAACVSNRVTIDATDASILSQSPTIHVSLDAAADTNPVGEPLDPALEDALRTHAEDALRAKGYAIGSATESDLILRLTPRADTAPRRTWSSDPDASGPRIVRKSEAVITLLAGHRGESGEVWRSEARARLAESSHTLGTSARAVWTRVLDKALEPIPDRR